MKKGGKGAALQATTAASSTALPLPPLQQPPPPPASTAPAGSPAPAKKGKRANSSSSSGGGASASTPTPIAPTGVIPPAAIQAAAKELGMAEIGADVASFIATTVEYQLREIIEDATKVRTQSRRQALTTEDFNYVMRLRGQHPLYGYGAGAEAIREVTTAEGRPGMVVLSDLGERKEDLAQAMQTELPKVRMDVYTRSSPPIALHPNPLTHSFHSPHNPRSPAKPVSCSTGWPLTGCNPWCRKTPHPPPGPTRPRPSLRKAAPW